MRVAILTSPDQWFESYAFQLSKKLGGAPVFNDHRSIDERFDVVFVLSYHRIIESQFLEANCLYLVIHESDLPEGKGWAPLFWQVLEGKHEITFSMFAASPNMDAGPIYMKRELKLTGYELSDELRLKQAVLSINMCIEFIESPEKFIPPTLQEGDESFYAKRGPKDSRVDPKKTIEEQFNLLRIVNNEEYPAFFELGGHKYKLKIEEVKK